MKEREGERKMKPKPSSCEKAHLVCLEEKAGKCGCVFVAVVVKLFFHWE